MKKSFWAEFKEFISRGSVIDLAVGVIVGNAFTAIVNSLVKDVIMPFIGWLIYGIRFEDFKLVLAPKKGDLPETAVYYGSFIQQVINFIIIAFVVFLMIKLINRLRRRKDMSKTDAPPADIALLTEIRNLLKENK